MHIFVNICLTFLSSLQHQSNQKLLPNQLTKNKDNNTQYLFRLLDSPTPQTLHQASYNTKCAKADYTMSTTRLNYGYDSIQSSILITRDVGKCDGELIIVFIILSFYFYLMFYLTLSIPVKFHASRDDNFRLSVILIEDLIQRIGTLKR